MILSENIVKIKIGKLGRLGTKMRSNYYLTAISRLFYTIILTTLLISCDSNNHETAQNNPQQSESQPLSTVSSETPEHHLAIVLQESKTLFGTLNLECATFSQSLIDFIDNKTERSIQTTYRDWNSCHEAYINTRLLRALTKELEILHPELDTEIVSDSSIRHSNHSKLDKFPMLPGYLDSVESYPYSGLMHSDSELSYASLIEEHQLGDEAYVAIGFHAIEFMLVGEQATTSLRLKDYTPNGEKQNDKLVKRRSKYLSLLGQILAEDIQNLSDKWKPETGYYLNQLNLISSQRLDYVLRNLIEVEIQAVQKIREMQKASPARVIHDTEFTLTSREELAKRIKQKIIPPTSNGQVEKP